mgnify:CR=1 FL=1
MRQILITVAGRNSAGKSLIAKKVAEALGLNVVKSYATENQGRKNWRKGLKIVTISSFLMKSMTSWKILQLRQKSMVQDTVQRKRFLTIVISMSLTRKALKT